MASNSVREHPVWDRPLEFASGVGYAAAALVIIISTLVTGAPAFAPRYLAEISNLVVLLYAGLVFIAGALVVAGLIRAYFAEPMFARYMEAIGHVVLALVTLTYAADLVIGGFSSPRNTLLLGFFGGRVGGSLMRAFILIRANLAVTRTIRALSNGGATGGS